MNDNSKVIDQDGAEVLDPRKALAEQTLAVDLANVEINQQIATAHKYPRSIDVVIKKIRTLACYNADSAENCIYALPRAGKPIIGPSIGFANIVMQAWGNCRVGARITYIDTKQKVVIAEGGFLDLETNAQSLVPVNRRIVDSRGRIYSEDMQIVTGMAAASIARRNAILQGVSRGLWHPIWLEALNIVRGDGKTFAENKEAAFKALAQFGVKPEQVVMYLGLKGDADLTFEHIPTIRGMYVALRDNSVTVEEMFDPRRMTGKGFETVENPLGGAGDESAPEAAQQAQEPEPPAAEAKPAAAATTAPPAAATTATEAKPDAGDGGDLLARAQPKQEAKPAAAAEPEKKEPANAAEYVEHWRTYCTTATGETAIKQAYANERGLRKRCEPFTEEQFEEMDRIKADRVAELKKKA